jgi:peptidoglycan/LPS O-acetylase OafA/YrhL
MGLLRLVLALSIVCGHAGAGFIPGDTPVQCFYAISGFYMALVLNEKYGRGPDGYALFLSNRYLRLFPIYAAVLVLTMALAAAVHVASDHDLPFIEAWKKAPTLDSTAFGLLVASIVTMLGQDLLFFVPPYSWPLLPIPQSWTLGVELSFYILAPLIVRRSLTAVIGIMLASIAVRLGLQFAFGLAGDPWSYRFFPSELAVFCVGVLGYRVYRAQFDRRTLYCLVTMSVLVGAALLLNRWNGAARAASVSAFVVAAISIPWLFRFTAKSQTDRLLGELSYPMYVCHFAAIWFVDWLFVPSTLQRVAAAVGLTFLLSFLLYYWIDRPVEKWRQARVSPRHSQPSQMPLTAPAE